MTRVRSPNYPAVDLEEAIKLAKALYDRNQLHAVPVEAVNQAWGFKEGSTYGKQCIAALKAFGLAETKGTGNRIQVAVTKTAAKIVERHADRDDLLRIAALRPKIHETVWNQFKGDLPPDAALNHYLLFDHEPAFNKAAIPKFLSELRSTVNFAGLSTRASKQDDHDETPADTTDAEIGEPEGTDEAEAARATDQGVKKDVFSLPEGTVTLTWPSSLSAASFEDMKDWLELMQRKIKRGVTEA